MMTPVKILDIKQVTHDVKQFKLERPQHFNFISGQAVEFEIDGLISPFTIVSTNEDHYLEFIIKIYEKRNRVTKKLNEMKIGEEIDISEPFGTISYKGKGTFIAGGAGITPFISIFRELSREKELGGNTLIFSNKTKEDIILKEELDSHKDLEKIYLLDSEDERINEEFLKANIKNLDQYFYICGSVGMVGELTSILIKMGADPEKVIIED